MTLFSFKKRVSVKHLLHFTRQLSILISAGTPLIKSLNTICDQMPEDYFKEIISSVIKDVENGSSLSNAISQYPEVFSHLFVNMVKAGEAGGLLPNVLKRIDHFLNHDHRLKEKVKVASMYPTFVLIMATVILTVLTAFVVPTFTKVFKDLGGNLPVATQILIAISSFVNRFWWIIPFLFFGIFFGYQAGLKNQKVRDALDRFRLRIPIIGHLIQSIEISRFSRLLGTLIMSGVPILEALKITRDTTDNSLFIHAIDSIHDKIEKGGNVYSSMLEHGIFPRILSTMVSVGEESGQIDKILLQVADEYEEEVEDTLTSFIALLEPILIVVMGLIVGFIVMALFFPIFMLGGLVK